MSTAARLARRQHRTQRKAAQCRQDHAAANAMGREGNRKERRRIAGAKPAAEQKRQAIVAAMSNRERNAWARAGYPADEAAFGRFAAKAVERMGRRMAA
jgi:hypothetical protein